MLIDFVKGRKHIIGEFLTKGLKNKLYTIKELRKKKFGKRHDEKTVLISKKHKSLLRSTRCVHLVNN